MVQEPAGWHEVAVANSLVRVSSSEPVAIIRRRDDPDEVVTWTDLPIGMLSPLVRVAAAPSGVWVIYTPAADEVAEHEGTESRVASTVIHISPAGHIIRFLDLVNVHLVGATRHGVWLWAGHWDANVDIAADWLKVRELLVLDVGGGTCRTSIDRIPSMAYEDGTLPRLVVYASAPDAIHDAYGGIGYTYRYLQIDLPAGDPPLLPFGSRTNHPLRTGGCPRERRWLSQTV